VCWPEGKPAGFQISQGGGRACRKNRVDPGALVARPRAELDCHRPVALDQRLPFALPGKRTVPKNQKARRTAIRGGVGIQGPALTLAPSCGQGPGPGFTPAPKTRDRPSKGRAPCHVGPSMVESAKGDAGLSSTGELPAHWAWRSTVTAVWVVARGLGAGPRGGKENRGPAIGLVDLQDVQKQPWAQATPFRGRIWKAAGTQRPAGRGQSNRVCAAPWPKGPAGRRPAQPGRGSASRAAEILRFA